MFIRNFDLTDMCLQVIAQNLDLFISSKTVSRKHVDFLFRLHSEDIFQKYKSMKKKIEEDCMLWFLNPNVKKVTLPRNLHSEKIVTQLKAIGSRITSLNLKASRAAETVLNSIISCFPHVTDLNLRSTSCTNETLSFIKKVCPDLISLDISNCDRVTDDGMELLCGDNLSLKNLNISGTNVEPMGVYIILNRMPSLECIKYDNFSEILEGLCEEMYRKTTQYNLTEIVFDDCLMVEELSKLIQVLAKMFPKVKKLHFNFPTDKKVLQACTEFQNLEELKIKNSHRNYYDVRDGLTPILPISNNLKTLILSCLEIPIVTLIDYFPNLENLYLKKVQFTDFKEEDIKITETKLNNLVIKSTKMEVSDTTYKGVALLISLSRNVTKLHLSHIQSLPIDIFDIILSSMKKLALINLYYTSVKLHDLLPLFDMPLLKVVYTNCFEDDATSALAHKSSCTLAWRQIYDDSDDEMASDYDNDDYDDDDDIESNEFSDHVISDDCDSESENDDRYSFYNNFNYGHDYDFNYGLDEVCDHYYGFD